MSINLNALESTRTRWQAPSDDYPQGKFINGTGAGKRDGSFCKAEWANDIFGFLGAVLKAAGIEPNGKVETATDSQVFTALTQIITNAIEADSVLVNVPQELSGAQKEQVRQNIGAGTSSLVLATEAETKDGTVSDKAVSPKNLNAVLQEQNNALQAQIAELQKELAAVKTSIPEAIAQAFEQKLTFSTEEPKEGETEMESGSVRFVYEE